jgi:hypothetical protein
MFERPPPFTAFARARAQPVHGFGSTGVAGEAVRSGWETPLVVEVTTSAGSRWIGELAAGGLGGVTGLCACPNPYDICAVVDGQPYLTDVRAPDKATSVLPYRPVTQAVAIDQRPLLLLVSFTRLVALGPEGVAWKSRRLGVDGLEVRRTTPETMECTVDTLDGSDVITVDASTGEQVSGRRFDSYWPRDALG